VTLRAELAWCLLSPPLPAPRLPTFPTPSTLCQRLIATLPDTEPPRRLGRRFESHWRLALDALPGHTVLAANLQIQHEGRTLGAPDLLLAAPGQIWHLELAVKFYLCRPDRSGDDDDDWIGPSARDSLGRKLRRIKNHQLTLFDRPAGRATLRAHNLPDPTAAATILRGVLFSHWQQPHPRAAGRWCHLSDLPAATSGGTILSRQEWLGATPAAPHRTSPELHASVREELADGMVQLTDAQGRRLAVVHDGWPEQDSTDTAGHFGQ
jgi:hypothetical protein